MSTEAEKPAANPYAYTYPQTVDEAQKRLLTWRGALFGSVAPYAGGNVDNLAALERQTEMDLIMLNVSETMKEWVALAKEQTRQAEERTKLEQERTRQAEQRAQEAKANLEEAKTSAHKAGETAKAMKWFTLVITLSSVAYTVATIIMVAKMR